VVARNSDLAGMAIRSGIRKIRRSTIPTDQALVLLEGNEEVSHLSWCIPKKHDSNHLTLISIAEQELQFGTPCRVGFDHLFEASAKLLDCGAGGNVAEEGAPDDLPRNVSESSCLMPVVGENCALTIQAYDSHGEPLEECVIYTPEILDENSAETSLARGAHAMADHP